MSKLLDMVVAKGRTVMHDGMTYNQNSRIRLPEDEASRLKAAGFVLSLSEVRGLLVDPDGGADDGNGDGGDGISQSRKPRKPTGE